jgi:hypothetical protein
MIVTAWILLIIFGWFTVATFITGIKNWIVFIEFLVCAFISAISAGVLFGGLKLF